MVLVTIGLIIWAGFLYWALTPPRPKPNKVLRHEIHMSPKVKVR